MSRRIVVTALLPQPGPNPTYPEYEESRQEARRRGRRPIGGQDIARMEDVIQRHGADWCAAVLGRPFPGLHHVPSEDGFMLLVADERGLEPELPESIVAARAAEKARRQERESQAAIKLQAEKRDWALVIRAAPVLLTVRENTRHTGVQGSLRHITAAVDLLSGRSRLHKAGMGLCETPGRSKPLHLGGPLADLPPKCRRCIEYAGQVRTLDASAPATPSELATLRLVQSGVVFTFRPARGGPTARDTSQPSKGAWGHLGRKVDAAVNKVAAKGWVVKDQEHSRTEGGHFGDRWRLSEAGTTALKG